MEKDSFILYANYFDILQDLSDEDAGILFKAILNYQANNIIPDLPAHLKMAFKFIKNQFDIDDKKYSDKVEKAKANGLKGGRPRKTETEENQKNQMVFKKPNGLKKSLNDNVNVNVNDNVNVNVNDNVFINKKTDLFLNPIKETFLNEFEKQTGKKPRLTYQECNKLIELSEEQPDFIELIPEAIRKLNEIDFSEINFKPSANWLLKDNNFVRVLNDEFRKETQKSKGELFMEKLRSETQ